MSSSDWLPKRESEFIVLVNEWISVIDEEGADDKYKWNPEYSKETSGILWAYRTARTEFENADTTTNRLLRNETRKVAEVAMRTFANSSVRYNRNMNEAVKQRMGIRPADKTPTPTPKPTIRPDMSVENTASRFQHRIKAINPENGKNTKPAGVHGVRFVWQIGGQRPASAAVILTGQFLRKPSLLMSYNEEDKGKVAWYACCYENARGEQGPWSPVEEVYIA